MANAFVVLNAGSTSVKFAAYTGDDPHSLDLVCRGQLDGIGSQPSFAAKNSKGEVIETRTWNEERPLDREEALKFVIAWVERHEAGLKIVAIGSRSSYRSCRCTSHSSWTPSARWQKPIPSSGRSQFSILRFTGRCQ
jgi:acetate kinase